MKIAALVARVLLGLVFVVFGANGLHPFLPTPPPPGGVAGQYIMALMQSHLFVVPAAVQFIGGLLLLVNRYVPLGLTILGPVNLPSLVPYHASQMLSSNIAAVVKLLVRDGKLGLDLEDQIIRETLVTHEGKVIHPKIAELLGVSKQADEVSQ